MALGTLIDMYLDEEGQAWERGLGVATTKAEGAAFSSELFKIAREVK